MCYAAISNFAHAYFMHIPCHMRDLKMTLFSVSCSPVEQQFRFPIKFGLENPVKLLKLEFQHIISKNTIIDVHSSTVYIRFLKILSLFL